MSIEPPSPSEETPEEQASQTHPRRRPELDKYVNQFLSSVCDTSRRYILELLAMPKEGDARRLPDALPEMRSGDIARAIGLSPATTSEHLHHLARTGLVMSRRKGNVVYYRLRNYQLVMAFHELMDALNTDYNDYGSLVQENKET